MPKSDQGVSAKRYQVIPRTLIFITRGDDVLLLRGAPGKRLWANRYNGIGGHIERGEDVQSAAQRELQEETGLYGVNLHLCGTVMVDASDAVGIAIYVFYGEFSGGALRESIEGSLEWIPRDQIDRLPLVEDLPVLLPRVLSMRPGDPPFAARSGYDDQERLIVQFS